MVVWLVTGCSSGFGKEIVLTLNKGDLVLATCRGSTNRIADLEKAGAITLTLDISTSSREISDFVKNVLELPGVKEKGGVDILVNNAGYVTMGGLEEISEDQLIASYNTNFFGHIYLTQALLPSFRERRAGTIAFIGSRGGFMNIPGVSAYTTAKYAIAGAADTLAAELEPFNIQVTCIEPGDFRTEVFKDNNYKLGANIVKDYDGTGVGANRSIYNTVLKQPGDPVKGSQRIVDLLRGDWQGAGPQGKKLPARLALGDDAFGAVRKHYESRLKGNDEWRDWICGTDFD